MTILRSSLLMGALLLAPLAANAQTQTGTPAAATYAPPPGAVEEFADLHGSGKFHFLLKTGNLGKGWGWWAE